MQAQGRTIGSQVACDRLRTGIIADHRKIAVADAARLQGDERSGAGEGNGLAAAAVVVDPRAVVAAVCAARHAARAWRSSQGSVAVAAGQAQRAAAQGDGLAAGGTGLDDAGEIVVAAGAAGARQREAARRADVDALRAAGHDLCIVVVGSARLQQDRRGSDGLPRGTVQAGVIVAAGPAGHTERAVGQDLHRACTAGTSLRGRTLHQDVAAGIEV